MNECQCDVIQVMVDLGNLTFETKSGSSRGAMNESNPDDDTLEEYDEDGELQLAALSLVLLPLHYYR